MSRRVRSKLTFANALAVIAIFAVIGGSAYAGSKISGKTLQNGTVGAKKLACPKAASSRLNALCYSPAQTAAGWITAAQTGCKNLGLRLPTSGEALLLLNKTGGETWADDIIVEGAAGAAARVQNGVVFSTAVAELHAYRCVTVVG